MLLRLFHLLSGSVRFVIFGDAARFLNLAAKSGFALWGFGREEEKSAACCRPKDYIRLRPLAKRSGARLKCLKKQGLPFQIVRWRRRPGLILGVFCAIALFWFLSGFVWGVRVSGTETLGDGIVLTAARHNGVYLGARKSGFVPRLSAHGIMGELPKLGWATVNTDGCYVEVVVREAERQPEVADDTTLSNLIAVRAGTVLAVEAERGRPEVAPGDTVQAGDLLISGSYQEKLDPWLPVPDDPFEEVGAARGRVVAETYREFAVQVSAEKKTTVPTGKRRVNRTLTVFGLRIPLGLNAEPAGDWRRYRKIKQLSALGVELPLAFEEDVYEFTEERTRMLSEAELKAAALYKLRQAQRASIFQGGEVLKEELVFSFPEGMCVLSAQCRCKEEIGEIQKVLVDSTETEE